MSFEVDTLGVGLDEDGVNGRIEEDKSCFCARIISTKAVCCFGGNECCV